MADSTLAFWNFLDFFFSKYFQPVVGLIHGFGTCGYGGLEAQL